MSTFVPSQRLIVDDSITTGQAVTLDITPASPLLRILATLIDVAGSIAFVIFTFYLWSTIVEDPSESMMRVYLILLLVTTTIGLPLFIEFFSRGRSLGKWAFGLRVVRDDGGVITLRHSLVRILVGLPEVWLSFGSLATTTTMLNLRAKRLGDFAAGTMVIREPEPVLHAQLIMPPDAVAWAQNAHLVRMPDHVIQRATMFLRSTHELSEQVRREQAVALAGEVSQYVDPKPPAYLHPERVIAALMVIHRDRDIHRLQRWEDISEQSRQRSARSAFGI